MWKLSTAFFPCSEEAFTRTPGPSAGSSVTAAWGSHCCCAERASWGSRERSQGWSPRTKAEALLGREGDTLGRAVELSPLLLSAHAVPLLWSELQQWGCWVNNELNLLEGSRGSLLLWHFLTETGSTFGPHLWPVSRATADPWAQPSLGRGTRARKCNISCGLDRSWKLMF